MEVSLRTPNLPVHRRRLRTVRLHDRCVVGPSHVQFYGFAAIGHKLCGGEQNGGSRGALLIS